MQTPTLLKLAWPAFLAACALELVVFAVVDPAGLEWLGDPLGWSRQAVYTAGFFVFWAVALAACRVATMLCAQPTGNPRP